MVRRDPETGIVSVPDWQLAIITTFLLTATGGFGGWAGYTLNEHSGSLAAHTEAISTIKETVKEQREMIRSQSDKLDRIFEELRKK